MPEAGCDPDVVELVLDAFASRIAESRCRSLVGVEVAHDLGELRGGHSLDELPVPGAEGVVEGDGEVEVTCSNDLATLLSKVFNASPDEVANPNL